jgi:arsenate reductase-like glutaredoxin family protein
VEERDIMRQPPGRDFLERKVSEDRFLDFISKRSPIFKQRPLPRSRSEAIDLMIEHPNLIKRPVLVSGATTVFGFDQQAYDRLAGRDG